MFIKIAMAIISFGAGVATAAGVFAFIVIIGIVPRLAQKSETKKYIILYENAIILGGVFATLPLIYNFQIRIGNIGSIIAGFSAGIFVGCLAVSLAEILDVIPILCRRINLKVGLCYFLVSIACGKLLGSIVYFLVPGLAEIK